MNHTFEYKVESVALQLNYTINVQHRNETPQKSQWTISEQDELNCFMNSAKVMSPHWINIQKHCWGLWICDDRVEYLGRAARRASNSEDLLFIAKFVGDHRNIWHGYPADHVNNSQDIPKPEILDLWNQNNYLNRRTIRKISKGQKCRL